MEELIKLSVIIPTSNRSKLLEKALLSITNQLFPKDFFEVIVVDNGSTDNTKDVAEKYGKELNLVYLYEPKPGLHEGRHAGFRIAKSDILVYADDDIEAFPEWLETIYKVFQKDENIVLVGGKNLPKFECTPPFWILKKWNNIIDEGHVLGELSILDFGNQEQEISPYFVFGCNFSVRKFIINNAGGFHPDGMPFELIKFRGDGETYISNYIKNNGHLAYYHPLASIYHWVPKDRMTEEYFFKRSYIQGVSDAYNKLRNVKTIKSYTKPGFLNKLKYFFKIFIGLECIKILEELKISVNKTDFEKNILKSYQSGYDYLHKMYHQDDEIKNWVHKKNYL